MTESMHSAYLNSLQRDLEALLFAASGPVSLSQLAAVLEKSVADIEKGVNQLAVEYVATRGLRIQWHSGLIQMTSAPEAAQLIERFLGMESTSRLSRAALETLAIIAYEQPVTRPRMEFVRGVNCDGVIRNLLTKGLIEEAGRADAPGRPILYATTGDFLQYFGLSSLTELPPMEPINEPVLVNGTQKEIFKD